MTESIGGLVPVGTLLDGITADQIGEHDPSGQTFIRLLGAIEYHARSRSTRWLNTSIWPRRAATRSLPWLCDSSSRTRSAITVC